MQLWTLARLRSAAQDRGWRPREALVLQFKWEARLRAVSSSLGETTLFLLRSSTQKMKPIPHYGE